MKRSICLLAALLLYQSALAADVPTPESQLGYKPGTDFKLTAWPSVVDYFRKVDAASDRVVVRELGKSTEDRPYLMAVVSGPETIKKLDDYQKVQRSLAMGTTNPVPSLPGKTVVLITCSIHSSETASTLMAMDLLHGLASGEDVATKEILDNTILLLVPSANPDGVDKVAAWYDRTRDKPWEGEGMPTLYHKYAGHDTNRDWFMLNLKETQLLTHVLYKEWFPTLCYDVHQMGSKGARMFVPPFFDPNNPNLDPKLTQGIALIGAHMAADLAAGGKQGVLTNAMYDNWWNGGMRTTPQRHNMVAVLTESASVKLASPIFVERDQLKGQTRGFTSHDPAVNFVDPWAGGWWKLRDIVDNQLITARSILTLGARYRPQFQGNQARLGQEAVARGRSEPPYGWVVPVDQRDLGTASKMLGILHDTGIEVRRARSPFVADGVTYPAGSWLLPADQPFRAHLKDMMERQSYPNRLKPDGTAEAPYDVAGWTLPLQMGVTSVALGTPYSGDFEVLDKIEPPKGSINGSEKPEFYTILNESNDDFRVVNALLKAGVVVKRVQEGLRSGDVEISPGTILFNADEKSRKVLDQIMPTVSTHVDGHVGITVASSRPHAPLTINPPSIAVYQPWVPSMDEGWTRLVLEQFDFPYTTIHDADVGSGNLADRFDVILLPSISAKTLREGYKVDESEPAYVGGLGQDGVASLRKFVLDGGKLVCLEDSCSFAIQAFGLPVKEVLKDLKTSEFYAPGSIFRAEPNYESAPGANMNRFYANLPIWNWDVSTLYFDRSLAFEPAKGRQADVHVSVTYAGGQPLESGWLLGPEKIEGKAALVQVAHGDGEVVLFGFPPQHRGQTHGTFRLLFNSLYTYELPNGR